MKREDILKKLDYARNLTYISDQGYWSKVAEIEYWERMLALYDQENKTPVEQS